jgi:hypothetical protein
LREQFAPISVGNLPPFAPFVGGEDALGLEVQPQDAETLPTLRSNLYVQRPALKFDAVGELKRVIVGK